MAKFGKTIGKVQAYAAYGGMKASQGVNRVKNSVTRAKNSVKYAYNNVKNRIHIKNKTNAQNKFSKDSYKARESGKKSIDRLKAYNAGSMAKMDDIKSKQAELWKNLGVSSSSGPAPAVARAIPTATARRARRPSKPSSKVLPLGAKPSSKPAPSAQELDRLHKEKWAPVMKKNLAERRRKNLIPTHINALKRSMGGGVDPTLMYMMMQSKQDADAAEEERKQARKQAAEDKAVETRQNFFG